jgi:hypothetical protein
MGASRTRGGASGCGEAEIDLVGWVERSETHRLCTWMQWWVSLRSTHPTAPPSHRPGLEIRGGAVAPAASERCTMTVSAQRP